MSELYRTFIALKIHPENKLLHIFNELRTTLAGEAIKWVGPENLHLTLNFLGDTSEMQLKMVEEILHKTANHFHPLQFQLRGLGYFKTNGQPRVLFAGIHNFELLQQLASDLGNSLSEIGFEEEKRGFKPHLTIARIKFLKNRKLFYSLVEKFDENEIQSVTITEVVYYQSILKPAGPAYIPLHKVYLKG